MAQSTDDFDVIIDRVDNGIVLMTSADPPDLILAEAFRRYDPTNKQYSTLLSSSASSGSISLSDITTLAQNAQSSLSSITRINEVVATYINSNDLLGKVASAVEDNVNTEYTLSYNNFDGKAKQKTLKKAKQIIDDFNNQIHLKQIIRTSIPMCYIEGNYMMYLRKKDSNYVVDSYPLGVYEISDYLENGYPVLLINMSTLKNRIRKTNYTDASGNPLFYANTDDEIKATYPEEVYTAYSNGSRYARLNTDRTGLMRVGNMNKKYGLTPLFRAMKPILMLESFDAADNTNTKAKAKKIIFQKLRKEISGADGKVKHYTQMAYAHDNFLSAFNQDTVVVTTPAYVEDIKYVEPDVETTDTNLISSYRTRALTTLGIGFLSEESDSASVAKLNLSQLMLTINKISEQLEDIINKWYQTVLTDNGIDIEFAPKIKVIDSEQMDYDLKIRLADTLFSKFNASYETCMGVVGIDARDEMQKRLSENSEGYEDIFRPRMTNYTYSSDNNGAGRPAEQDPDNSDKSDYDSTYNEFNRD